MVALALLMIAGLPLASAEVPVAPPMDLAATAVQGGVELTWNPPVGASGGTTYAVYRDGVLLDGSVEALSFVDTTPLTSPGTTVYAVTAITPFGESLPAMNAFTGDCIHHDPDATPEYSVNPWECIGN